MAMQVKKGVYFDEEENRRRLNTIKLAHAQIARSLAQAGRKEEAEKGFTSLR